MWSWIAAHADVAAGGASAMAAITAMLVRLRPRRLFGWIVAIKEREALSAMLEYQQQSARYWQAKAEACLDRLRNGDPE